MATSNPSNAQSSSRGSTSGGRGGRGSTPNRGGFWRGRGGGERGGAAGASTASLEPSAIGGSTSRGHHDGRARGRGQSSRGGGRGGRGGSAPRPTHFLALPLKDHAPLRTLVSQFQSSLLTSDPPITGLDKTIVIDPRRLHLTLGVMSLEDETVPDLEQSTPPIPRKTVTSALALLTSLKPRITSILSRFPAEDTVSSRNLGVQVPLNHLDVFPPGSTTGSSVLFLGPDMSSIQQRNSRRGGGDVESRGREGESEEVRELRVLWDVADFVHQEFKKARYIVEKRPLKLHCTILNTSHRKPRPRGSVPFSFDDIVSKVRKERFGGPLKIEHPIPVPAPSSSRAATTLSASISTSSAPASTSASALTQTASTSSTARQPPNSHPRSQALRMNAGTYEVRSIELWVMGSHGPDNEYVSVGGIWLDDDAV